MKPTLYKYTKDNKFLDLKTWVNIFYNTLHKFQKRLNFDFKFHNSLFRMMFNI